MKKIIAAVLGVVCISTASADFEVRFGPDRPHYRHRYYAPRPIGPQPLIVGSENDGAPLYLCQARFRGGMHPGKVVNGNCNITYDGVEIPRPHYQLFNVDQRQVSWATVYYPDRVPPNAFQGGYENGRPLYVCRGFYAGGTHPGKVVKRRCNIGYDGREILVDRYEVLMNYARF